MTNVVFDLEFELNLFLDLLLLLFEIVYELFEITLLLDQNWRFL